MKTFTNTIAATALTLSLTSMAAQAADRVVVLADMMPETHARMVLAQSKRIMADMRPGDTLTFMDGRNLREIAQLNLPIGAEGQEILESKRKTSKFFGSKLATVQNFIVASTKTPAPQGMLSLQANLPGVLGELSLKASMKPDVIVFGSLRYEDEERMPGYSMAHKFPNDAHMFMEPSRSPFGAAGMDGVLDGTRVHFCQMDTEKLKDLHTAGLERATGLLVQGYGATLATSSENIKECVSHAFAGKVDQTKAFVPDTTQTRPVIYDIRQTARAPAIDKVEQRVLFARMKLPQDKKDAIAAMMATKKVVLAEVQLYDTHHTDGDVVALVSGSVEFEVALTKTKQTVIVPITNNTLRMRGVRDGQGGITVGVLTTRGEKLTSPVMKVGETIELPFVKLKV